MPDDNRKTNVVYKFVTPDKFYAHLKNYLDGKLYFADWHSFEDKREGKYFCSSAIKDKDFIKETLKQEKWKYKVCSTTTEPDIFKLWDRYLKTPPAICLKLEIDELDVANHDWQYFECFFGKLIEYQSKIPAFNKLEGDYEAKAIRILTTKRNLFAWEQEFRLMLDAQKAEMTKVGTVKEIILGGCCHKSDARFNKIRSEVCKKGIPVSYAYLDFEHETVEIQQAAECAMCNNRGQK